MKPADENPILVAVAMTIADGLPVDWESLAAAYPELVEDLEVLRVLQNLEASRHQAPPGPDSA